MYIVRRCEYPLPLQMKSVRQIEGSEADFTPSTTMDSFQDFLSKEIYIYQWQGCGIIKFYY